MNFNNFAKEGWGWFEHFFWVGACCQRGGRFSKGGGASGILEKAIRSFTSKLLFNLLFTYKLFFAYVFRSLRFIKSFFK